MRIVEKNRAITLIALVVTIVILLILAGVTIATLTGENGILTRAIEAKNKTKNLQAEELSSISQLENEIQQQKDDGFDKSKGVNRPQLTTGMTRIMFKEPTENDKGTVIKDGETGWSQNDWYDYTENNKRWANVTTKDGSMWVWIPRYAYKLDSNKNMEIKFLVGTSNKWYNPDTDENEDLPEGYIIHPCFQNGSKTGYKNGEWREEVRGIWVAKFEAALPDNSQAPKTTSIPTLSDCYYPIFQGQKHSYNYINVSECYLLSKCLTENNNPYGLTSNSNSHLIKNSEWGAVAYLSYSKYGKTGGNYDTSKEIYINNVLFDGEVKDVRGKPAYGITGYAGKTASAMVNIITDTKLEDVVSGSEESYVWYTKKGTQASSTETIYGIYDLNGGEQEYTSSFIANEDNPTSLEYLKRWGYAFAFKDNQKNEINNSTEYITRYPKYDENQMQNALRNEGRYGDAILETWNWMDDITDNNASGLILIRGGWLKSKRGSGVFMFDDIAGWASESIGFRTTLIIQ